MKSQLLESNNKYELIINNYKSKIEEYEKIFQIMKSKIEDYEKNISNSYEEISKYKSQIEESNSKLDECEKQLKLFSSSDKHRINVLQQELESKTQRLKEITQLSIQQNQKLTESMNRITDLEKSRENNDDLKRRIEILENQADVFRANERRLQRRISELKDKLVNTSKYEEMYSELEKKFKESQEMAKSAIKRLTIEMDRKSLEEATQSPSLEEMESLRQSLSEKEMKIKDLEKIISEQNSKVDENDENLIEVFDIAKFEDLSDSEFRKKALTIIGKLWLEKVSKSQSK
ncbi:tropomyosin family [Trichomonas vaginalis G3]|uniref:tropomyosin family n=1 Tax=Trichomonas vaginalis (strain ATCC PRA-98 / G3) TaxID=412133 RepID=UPI0021E555AB|nr:tropomyosin family [Trichomonas vaginalis G3]KAI5540267.1 tropomyosin family [Trichomonas vaginalis G3]